MVRIEWDSAAGHLEGFRRNAEFRDVRAAVHAYVGDIAEMRHHAFTAVARRKPAGAGARAPVRA